MTTLLIVFLGWITAMPFLVLAAICMISEPSEGLVAARRSLTGICTLIALLIATVATYNTMQHTTIERVGLILGKATCFVLAVYFLGWAGRWITLLSGARDTSDTHKAFFLSTLRNAALGVPILAALALVQIFAFDPSLPDFFHAILAFAFFGVVGLFLELMTARERILRALGYVCIC